MAVIISIQKVPSPAKLAALNLDCVKMTQVECRAPYAFTAIREGRAMMRGEIPANRYHTIEEMLADLKR
ncbi:hypothetical protein AGMMS50293_11790 [Spirochaetia bacterium]|nr:hypothetical protein AGMMS50293_11790 [Spirochaetia bacterium]